MQPSDLPPFDPVTCAICQNGAGLDFGFSMAFQPIVDAVSRTVFAFEALVRGTSGESAGTILSRVNNQNRYRFDQACRVRAIELAAGSGMEQQLNINFLPNAVYQPESCIRATLEAAELFGFPHERLCFEVVESERIDDHEHVIGIIQEYKRQGLITAIDDFGAGYAGLNLLAEFQPDILKLDMALTRAIDLDRRRQIIVKAILGAAADLEIRVIAEGIETEGEYACLRALGVELFQGYLLGRPAFETFDTDVYIPA
ncbi:MAG TPA: EAL domain-containing protein [Pseudomonadales bacterium]|nr:EAL domain-containing protein [Pseudomonadales bacterium]